MRRIRGRREMLDLNVNDSVTQVSIDSICDETFDTPRQQLSSTSISSVFNATDDAPADSARGDTGDSGSTLRRPNFDKRDCGEASYGRSIELLTRQFFPVSGGDMEKTSNEIESQWLNLSVSESIDCDNQLRIFEDQKSPPLTRLKKSRRGPRSRSSQYRGVTFYRRTGRWESHIWDCGKQVYLGGFDTAHAAARAYDRAAVKFRGPDADINFTATDYEHDLKQTKDLTKEEFVHILRRQSNGLSRGSSKYRGVTLHKYGRWGTQMDQFLGKKASNKAAVECNGPVAEKNFVPNTYDGDVSLTNRNQESVDTQHNLDLSLWISPPSNSVRSLCLHDASNYLSGAKRTKVERFAPAPNVRETPHYIPSWPVSHSGLAPNYEVERFAPAPNVRETPHYILSWPVSHSGLAPNYEVTAMKNMESQVVPSHGISNWEWQTNSQGVVIPLPLFSTAAASSGFSFTNSKPPSYP